MTGRLILLLACVVALCLLAALFQNSSAEDKAQDQVAVQLNELQAKIARLEARVAELEKRPTYVTLPTAAPPPPVQPLPKGWQQREFNGMPYYLVPLQTTQGK